MFLQTEILGLQNPTDILDLREGIIYVNEDEPAINFFAEGTVNVRQEAEEFVIDVSRRMTLPRIRTITVVFRPLKALLPKRFNILATANQGQLTVELRSVVVSELYNACLVSTETGYKGTTLTCYAEDIRVRETSSIKD